MNPFLAAITRHSPLRQLQAALYGLAVLGLSGALQAAAITPGNLVVYRVGTGAAALTTAATEVFLDEYTTTGTLVQSIPLSTSGASALTATGNSASEGILSLSQDGSSVVFTGYRKAAGGTNPSLDAPSTTNRVIGTLSLSGTVSTSLAVTDSTGSIRSATTVSGSTYYLGTSTAVRYVATPGTAATSTVVDNRNSREVLLADNTLYATNGSTSITAKIQNYGTLPTTTTTPTPVATLPTNDAVNGFAFFDLSNSVAGMDTLYFTDIVANLLYKYTYNGTAWSSSGSVAGGGVLNLAGSASGGTVNVYGTTSSGFYSFSDSSGYGGTLTSGWGLSLATASTNTGFRGVTMFVAVPEPSAIGATIGAALGLLAFQRFRNRRRV